MYSAKGLDCDGVPTFSHGTANEIVKDHTRNLNEYTPLTVEIVRWWFGWYLYQLQNNELSFLGEEKNDKKIAHNGCKYAVVLMPHICCYKLAAFS